MSDDTPLTLADLDARLSAVEALQQMTLRILSITKPLDNVLDHFGATETQKRATYALLDELATRAAGREDHRPTPAYFEMKLVEIYPEKRNDREFRCLIIDTLKVERAAYRALHEYMDAHDWGKR